MRHSMSALLRGVLAASLLLLIQSLVDFTLQTPGVTVLWALILGLGYGVATGGQRSVDRDRTTPRRWTRSLSIWSPRIIAASAQGLALIVLWGESGQAAMDGYPLALRSAYTQAAAVEFDAPPTAARNSRIEMDLIKGLRQGPTDPVLWLMSARLNENRANGISAFARSYEVSSVDPTLMKWRSAFASAHWDQLSPLTRDNVMSELVLFRSGWGAEPWFRSLSARYQGTAFGAALALTLATPPEPSH